MSEEANKERKSTYLYSYKGREAEVPVPVEKENSKGWVEFGKDNLMPQFYFKLVYDSPIHGGIINQKTIFVSGNGVEASGSWADQDELIQKNGKSKMTLDEIVEEVSYDFEVQEGFYLLFKKNMATGGWYMDEASFEMYRPSKDLKEFYYSENWKLKTQSEEKTGFRVIPSIHEIDEKTTECILYVKSKAKQILLGDDAKAKLSSSIFPIVSYSGAVTSIMADIEMNWFHYAEVINGWTSNTILNLKDGVPEPDERKKIEKDIKTQSTDRKKKGGMMILYSDGGERSAELLNIGGNGNDTKYIATQEHLVKSIMIGHSVQNPALFGLEIAGKLGNTDTASLNSAFARFNETYIARRRKKIADAITYGLQKLNDLPEGGEITFKEYVPIFEQATADDNKVATALTSMSPLMANALLQVMTLNEKRTNLAGLPPIPGGNVIEPKGGGDEFRADDEQMILSLFEGIGRDRENVRFLVSEEFDGEREDSVMIEAYLKDQFQLFLTDELIQILNMVKDGESFASMAEALDMKAKDLASKLLTLEQNGYITGIEGDKEGLKLTDSGVQSIATAETLSVVYTYEVRPDAPDLVPGGKSRDFCATLIQQNRVYSREEINQISGAIGRDVWSYRGGWLFNTDTQRAQPSCRHYWKQNVIINN